MSDVQPLQRKEKPDFSRFMKVIRREGDASYVPFFELVTDIRHFAPLSGLEPPENMNFVPTSPTFEPSFKYLLDCWAKMGFDHGTINAAGFRGYPVQRHSVKDTGRGFALADDAMIRSWEDFENYPWPSAKDVDVELMERTANLAPEGLGVMTGSEALFQTMMLMLGMTGMSMLLADDPELVRAVADRIGAIQTDLFDLLASLPFIRGVIVSGDMGHRTGTMVSPDLLREMVLPWHAKFVTAIHRHGKIALLHSCGDLAEIVPDLVEIGYDAKHSFEDTYATTIYDLHKRYGRDICFVGGVDVNFLCRADESAIRRRVREMIDRLAPDGGWILGSGNSIPDYVPTENYRAMLDEGLKYGRP